jgi:hypothetical protein
MCILVKEVVMSNRPLMKCGHSAQSTVTRPDGSRGPACVICYGIIDGADVINDNPPSLEGRKAQCAYRKSCKNVEDSDLDLAFFRHYPDKEFDEYYCGCHGWD